MKPGRNRRAAARACCAAWQARSAVLAGAASVVMAVVSTSPLAADAPADPLHGTNASPTAAPAMGPTTTRSATDADAAKGTGFALPRQVIAGGGGSSSGGAFTITGTIGQPDADPLHPATGGVFAISGGFWPGIAPGAPPADPIFANGFEAP